jgi:phytoene synthase
MVTTRQVERKKRIQRQTGKTFHLATRLLPERVRHATYVLYAFFRVADEIVDTADPAPPADQRAELERLRAEALGEREPSDPVLAAFAEIRAEVDIADEDVELFIDAMRTDVDTSGYETYDELEAYMDGSAAAVGRMMTAVMDPDDPETALSHATSLGEAFQLTNFVRDVREDVVERDRIYLPQTTLEREGVTNERIERFEMDERVASVIRTELARAESLYRDGVAGIKYLPSGCQLPVLLAAVLYADHHRLIRKHDYDVLNNEVELSTTRKLWLVVRVRWHWQWNGDPEEVFRRVSAVPSSQPLPRGRHHESLPTR